MVINMCEYNNVPKIRFKGFTDVWEQRKLEEISNRFDNLRVPVSANEREKGTTPYYGANGIQDYVKGFTHNGEYVLIAEDGANDLKNYPVKYVNGLFWANNHVHVVQGKEGICDNKYLRYCFTKTNIESLLVGGGRAKLNANIMMSINLTVPSFNEQVELGRMFYELDNLITLHQRKFNDIIVYKLSTKFLFLKLAKNVWEQRKLGELYNFRYGDGNNNPSNGGKYDVYGANGIIGGYDKFNSENSIIIGHMGEYAGSVLWGEGKHFVTYNGTITRPKRNNIDDKFGYYMLYRKELNKICGGSGLPFLSYQELNKVEVDYSKNKDEQIKISKLLTDLDNLITLHHRKYTYIFYSWEQRKLDRLLEQYTEVTTINNQYPALTSSRKGIFFQTEYFAGNQIASQNNVGYNIVPRNYFTYRHMSDDEIFHFNINEICDFGIVSTLYPVFTTKKELDSKYLQYQLNYGKEFAKFASLQKQGGSRTYMYFAKLKELVLTMPKVEEQTKISSILSNIDNLITLHQHKELKRRNDNNEHLRW